MIEPTDKVNVSADVAAIPEVDASVKAHDQAASTDSLSGTLVDRNREGISPSSLDTALGNLAESDTRKFGVQVFLQMASAWAKETNTKFSILGNQNARLSDELMKVREENAAHRAKDTERSKHAPLVAIALMFGPMMITLGLNQIQSQRPEIGWPILAVGISILAAVLWTRKGNQ